MESPTFPSAGPTPASPGSSELVSPSLVSSTATARFEFETSSKGNEGTKVLMVEWESEEGPSNSHQTTQDWDVTWEGKKAALPVSDRMYTAGYRIYFLLPPGATVPAHLTITPRHGGNSLYTKPLPAIFTPGLSTALPDPGRRGVLHTIWARERLSVLQDEIDKEMESNSESVGLEMALQEKQWIIDHFGLGDEPEKSPDMEQTVPPSAPATFSPWGATGARLTEKLKGLKLATSPADLAGKRHDGAQATTHASILSRTGPEIAFGVGAPGGKQDVIANEGDNDDLFALPMSPRSPEMKRSPFSLL